MTDVKTCPKCKGAMIQGRMMRFNEYTARYQYVYVFAPDGESGPDISKMFSAKPLSKERKGLVTYCCEECGFVEFYGIATG